jgi:predicted acylesterase/phospholipase RssA
MTIKHLVIPGGGPSGIQALGALVHLENAGFWKIDDIEKIYATSAGAILAVLLCLKFDWETVIDYIIKRPWHEAFKVEIDQIFDAYRKKGIFDEKITDVFYKPFFDAKDLSLEITMIEFYRFCGIELHFFTLELNAFELVDLSHLTHPDLPLLRAVQMSAAIPILISPICVDNKCYTDGGIVCNYPLNQCIENCNRVDEIFGIRNNYDSDGSDAQYVKEESTIIEYMLIFMNRIMNKVKLYAKPRDIPYQLTYSVNKMNLKDIKEALISREKRQELFNLGSDSAATFLLNIGLELRSSN